LTLGSLGLLIGVFSFIIVVRKNMLARVQEISLYCALGFNDKKIQSLLYKENVIIPLTALITGILCAFLAVSYRLENISIGVWAMAIAFFGILVLSIMIFVKYTVKLVVSEESFCFHRCFAP
jgi:putative ABC transport system permease protein